MKSEEIFERTAITDGDRRLGYVSVRYPVTENKHIDKYYKKLADAFIKRAQKSNHTGMLSCRVAYEDEEYISIICEARSYLGTECIRRHRSSFVWDRKMGTLCYIRKMGIRRCDLTFNGRELRIFD
ncbi:MAG: hypothetical protein IKT46_08790 [Clostridia bacterium]|nr:hypothetical protein [Clostridia bacterium]